MANELRRFHNWLGGRLTYDLPAAATGVTDGATTNASTTLSSPAQAAFTDADVGAPVSGAGIPAGTYILSRTSATAVVMSAPATATASGVSVTISRHLVMHSAALAAMSDIDATEHTMVGLDPDGMAGAPEAVMATLHVGTNTWAQIARAQESTVARAHAAGMDWVDGIFASDFGLIGDTILAAAAATITFASIPAIYPALRLVFQGRTDRAGQPSDTIGLRVNGDAAANYRTPYLKGTGVAASSGVDAAAGYWPIGEVPGATATAGTPGMFEAIIPNYAGTTFHKTAIIVAGDTNGSTEEVRTSYGRWLNAAAITSLTIVVASGANLIAGSRATLHGVK